MQMSFVKSNANTPNTGIKLSWPRPFSVPFATQECDLKIILSKKCLPTAPLPVASSYCKFNNFLTKIPRDVTEMKRLIIEG